MRFSVLGPLRVDLPSGPVDVRGTKERMLLARLLVAGGDPVPVADLVDSLWPDHPPRTAAKSLQTYVLRLRNALEPDRAGAPTVLVTEGAGYRVKVDAASVDAARFERLVAMADRGAARDRLGLLVEALDLWRGPAYAGLTAEGAVAAEASRLEELRLGALEDRCGLELAAGRGRSAIALLRRLVVEHPLRERFWVLLVTALYRDGRQAEALQTYDRARAVLAEELGIDPGPELRGLQARVLAQDPALVEATGAGRLPVELSEPGTVHGRADELAVLRRAWERSAHDGPQVVVVRARPGAGGRTLSAALAREVADAGARVAYLTDGASAAPTDADLVVLDRVSDPAYLSGARLTVVVAPPGASTPPDATTIDLGPLDASAVRALVADYVDVTEVEQAAARVLADSGGWPARAHGAAVAYVRDRAAAEVRVASAEADRSRTALHDARERLTTGVLDLRGADPRDEHDPHRCPWPGLAPYDVSDGGWYAGRERLVAELLARLAVSPCLAVVGASGSGKSSLVRAGLLAALADDQLPGSAGWDVLVLRPGAHPLRELAHQVLGARRPDPGAVLERLVRSAGQDDADRRTVLVVDQLEEVWTQCADEAERTAFLGTLASLAAEPGRGTALVLAVRADYLDRVAEHQELADLVREDTVLVGSPTPADVRRVITRPAARAGLELEDGLADAVVSDAGQEPGVLPLLSTALAQLWEARSGRRVTFAHYVALGGLDGAIAHLAESVWTRLDLGQQRTARSLLLRLTGPGEGEQVTRRRVPVAELTDLDAADLPEVLEALTAARLLTRSGADVEVAHEALFREWPRLRGWLAEDAAGRAVRRRLAVAAAEWDSDGRDPTLLWRGPRLEAGLEAAAARPEEVTGTERAFLDAARAAAEEARLESERQVAAERRQNRRLRSLLVGLGVLLVVALVAGLLALVARGRAADAAADAEQAAVAADAKRLAATALSVEYPDLALLAAVEATTLEESPETYGALLTLLARQPDVVTGHRTSERFLRVAATADGSTVLVSENGPVLRALDSRTGEELWVREDLAGQVGRIAPGPDGRTVAVTVLSPPYGSVELLDVSDGSRLWRIEGREAARHAGDASAPWLWFGIGWTGRGEVVFANDTHVLTADATGRLTDAVPWGRPVQDMQSMLVWPDRTVTTGWSAAGPGVRVDLGSGESAALPPDTAVAAVSPDGDRAVLVEEALAGSRIRVASPETWRSSTPTWPVDGFVGDVAFAPDGREFAAAVDETVLLRDGTTAEPLRTLEGHSGTVMGVAYAGPRGDLLWTAGRDGRAVGFDATGGRGAIGTTSSPGAPVAGESAGGVTVWTNFDEAAPNAAFLEPGDGSRPRRLPLTGLEDCACQATGTELTPDGRLALAGMLVFEEDGPAPDRGHVVVWDTATREVRGVVDTPWPVTGIGATPDGTRAVLNGSDGWALLDLSTLGLDDGWTELDPVDPFAVAEGTALVEVAPDGERAALLRGDRVVLVDLGSREVVATSRPEGATDLSLMSAGWAPDSSALAVGSMRGWFHVLDGTTLEPVAPRRLITGGFVIDVEVSPDGRTAATLGSDGDATLWDTGTWRPYGLPVTDDRGWGLLAFDEDSSALDVRFEDGLRTRVAVRPAAWVAAACAAANRELTAEELAVLRPGAETSSSCTG